MASMKALVAMVVWSAVAAWAMNAAGFVENSREFIWAVAAAVALLIILMVNVWIYFLIARDEPWKWFRT